MPVPEQARFTTPSMADTDDTRRLDQQFNQFPIFARAERAYGAATLATTRTLGTYADVAGVSVINFFKNYDWTDIFVRVDLTSYATTAGTVHTFGMSVNGAAAIEIVQCFHNVASNHATNIGWKRLAGGVRGTNYNAGKHTFQLQWASNGVNVANLDTYDRIRIVIEEVIPAQAGSTT
jgi:hypothetical protein